MSTAGETNYDRVNEYTAVKIRLASPQDILNWSSGEVKRPETINYRTYRPERDGLFCERIFGPEKDFECSCGKYRGMKYKGMLCDRCGVKVTHSKIRRKRMGHIELAAPVVHIWFFRTSPCRIGSLLNMKISELERVIYFQDYVVIDPGDTPLRRCQLLTEEEYRNAKHKYGEGSFDADMGAEAIKRLLHGLNLEELSRELRADLKANPSEIRRKDLVKRLKTIEALRDSKVNRPEWMVLDRIPVIPPDLRPLVMLDAGNFASSDLNDLYRRIINRNNRLKKLVDLNAPEVIVRNEKRMLQQSVDALIDNDRCKRPVIATNNRQLKSLADMIRGKQGRFRENLLGKRVDYSARSVIVVGPTLQLHQCGLPKKIALELFQPFIIRRLKERGQADTIKSARRMLERRDAEVWDILEEVIKNHPVLLNRAPTLHRMGIQAFEPVLVEGNAIHIHPLVCKAYNADFDGDQMAVHLPLSIEAQVEATILMMSTNNVFSPANGSPIITPTQDIVMGCYYATMKKPDRPGHGMVFPNLQAVHTALQHGKVTLHTTIKVRLPRTKRVKGDGEATYKPGSLIETSVGRVMFNDILHPQMSFYNLTMKNKDLSTVISDCYLELGRRETIALLDRMKEFGFTYSTRSGLSFAISDLITPSSKQNEIERAEKEVYNYERNYQKGMITWQERYQKVLDAWQRAAKSIQEAMMDAFRNDVREGGAYVNPIFLMAESGARGGVDQIKQLAGMRGLMSRPSGEIIETPIKSNFREGLSVLEYFSSTHGARKGLADTALKTADSGYLTRKLADVCQNVVVTMHDCGTTKGITRGVVYRGEKTEVSLADAIRGRVSRSNIVDPITDEVIVRENELITMDIARKIEAMGLERIHVRSPLTCEAELGVCRLCYGMDLSTGALVEEGLAVGIIAAQSIGEPGTQLTMRTFHIGGAGVFETQEREVKAKKSGRVRLVQVKSVTNAEGQTVALGRNGEIAIIDPKDREVDRYSVPNGAILHVKENDLVEQGQVLCSWDPHSFPLLSEVGGRIRFEDLVEGDTLKTETDQQGNVRRTVMESRSNRHPQVIIEDQTGNTLDYHYLPEKASLEVQEGQIITAGAVIAKVPRETQKTQDITGGLPRVTELFEARIPKDPAVIAQIDGEVEIKQEKKRGRRILVIRGSDGSEVEHILPTGQQLLVHKGDRVKAGDPLVRGPLVPQDILEVSGEEAVQQYLLHEIQSVYRAQKVSIDDKHIELVIAQMLRRVRVDDVGDTNLLPGTLIDKFEFRRINQQMLNSVRVTEPGDSEYHIDDVVPLDKVQDVNNKLMAEGKRLVQFVKARPAIATPQLLGISRAAVGSDSFISAASFQETTKVLTEAALAGRVDRLVGLKENVILGHLIPAGTGFKTHVKAQVRFSKAAEKQLEEAREQMRRARSEQLNESGVNQSGFPV